MSCSLTVQDGAVPLEPPPHLISPEDVHVWVVDLAAHAEDEAVLRALLDPYERNRADLFHFARDRIRFVVAHAAVRRLLGSYAGLAPETLEFEFGEFGKPALSERCNRNPPLTFNLAHSGERALVAVARGRRVGVDLERWTADIPYDDVAAFSFSVRERGELRELPEGLKQGAFFACWSRKEAYLKAQGVGISQGLEHFDVSLSPGAPAQLLADRRNPRALFDWAMLDLEAEPGYSAALVAEGKECRVEQYWLSMSATAG